MKKKRHCRKNNVKSKRKKNARRRLKLKSKSRLPKKKCFRRCVKRQKLKKRNYEKKPRPKRKH